MMIEDVFSGLWLLLRPSSCFFSVLEFRKVQGSSRGEHHWFLFFTFIAVHIEVFFSFFFFFTRLSQLLFIGKILL